MQVVHSDETLSWSHQLVNSFEDYRSQSQKFLSSIGVRDERAFMTPPLWIRSFSVDSDEKQTYVVIVMHHALYDGLSVGKLLDTVERFYNGGPSVPTKQFYELLPQIIRQEQQGTRVWIDRLRQYHPRRLLPMYPSMQQSSIFVETSFTINWTQISSLIQRAGVTPQCIAQAAFVKLIARESKCQEVVFGHTISGRNMPTSEEVIGPVLVCMRCSE